MPNKPYNILTDYKGSGNNIVDAIALCIMYHRKKKIGLKAIHLKPPVYDQFKKWFIKEYEVTQGKKFSEEILISFDKVDIEKGSIFQSNPILPEYYEDFTRNMVKTLILPN
jgi:hypothetical protein